MRGCLKNISKKGQGEWDWGQRNYSGCWVSLPLAFCTWQTAAVNLASSTQQKAWKERHNFFSEQGSTSVSLSGWTEAEKKETELKWLWGTWSVYMLNVFMAIISEEVQGVEPSHASNSWVLSGLNCDHLSCSIASLLPGQGAIAHLSQVQQLVK